VPAPPYVIDIQFYFPLGRADTAPVVLTPPTRIDSVVASHPSIRWQAASHLAELGPLRFSALRLFSDAAKTRAVPNDQYFSSVTCNGGTVDAIFHTDRAVALTTLYYTLTYVDAAGTSVEFDPTLKIQPRSAETPKSAGAS